MSDTAGMEVEKMLVPLIIEHGLARVLADLEALIPKAKWQDWQRVANIATNIDRRLRREQQAAA
jgi:hypothetical protein